MVDSTHRLGDTLRRPTSVLLDRVPSILKKLDAPLGTSMGDSARRDVETVDVLVSAIDAAARPHLHSCNTQRWLRTLFADTEFAEARRPQTALIGTSAVISAHFAARVARWGCSATALYEANRNSGKERAAPSSPHEADEYDEYETLKKLVTTGTALQKLISSSSYAPEERPSLHRAVLSFQSAFRRITADADEIKKCVVAATKVVSADRVAARTLPASLRELLDLHKNTPTMSLVDAHLGVVEALVLQPRSLVEKLQTMREQQQNWRAFCDSVRTARVWLRLHFSTSGMCYSYGTHQQCVWLVPQAMSRRLLHEEANDPMKAVPKLAQLQADLERAMLDCVGPQHNARAYLDRQLMGRLFHRYKSVAWLLEVAQWRARAIIYLLHATKLDTRPGRNTTDQEGTLSALLSRCHASLWHVIDELHDLQSRYVVLWVPTTNV